MSVLERIHEAYAKYDLETANAIHNHINIDSKRDYKWNYKQIKR